MAGLTAFDCMLMAAAAGGLDPDAAIYIAAMTVQPNAARKAIINTLFLALKAAGVFALLDEFWGLAAHDEQAALLGCKRYRDITAVNAPVWTVDRGYVGAVGKYLDTGYVPATDGVQYTLNDMSAGVYTRTDAAIDGCSLDTRDWAGGVSRTSVIPRWTDGKAYWYANGTVGCGFAVADSLGLYVTRRTASDAAQGLKNGSVLVTTGDASTFLPTNQVRILALNQDGTPLYWDTRQHSFAFVGAAMTLTQQADFFTAVEAYLDAIGAGVVP